MTFIVFTFRIHDVYIYNNYKCKLKFYGQNVISGHVQRRLTWRLAHGCHGVGARRKGPSVLDCQWHTSHQVQRGITFFRLSAVSARESVQRVPRATMSHLQGSGGRGSAVPPGTSVASSGPTLPIRRNGKYASSHGDCEEHHRGGTYTQ